MGKYRPRPTHWTTNAYVRLAQTGHQWDSEGNDYAWVLAEKERIDLIILGSHGSGLLHAFGSTTMGVTYDVPCDVLVVRATE